MILPFWLLVLLAPAQGGVPTPAGEWHNTDYRAVEVLPNACVRVWLEERKYAIQTSPDNSIQGAYQNVIRAIPAGAPSLSPRCVFPPPTENPIAHQMRMWSVVGSAQGAGVWKLRAQPGPGGGDFATLKAEEFSTELRLEGGSLRDGVGPIDDGDKVLVFRRPGPSPAGSRDVLEAAIAKLHGGGCLEVMNSMPFADKSRIPGVCDLRRQMLTTLGRYVSLTVSADTQIDRVSKAITSPGTTGFVRQRAVFFEFTGTFEGARVPGNALVVEEAGIWRLAALWF